MKLIAAMLALGLVASVACAQSYDQEYWDDAGAQHNDWACWDLDYQPTHPHDHNRPMDWHATGGVAGSGYVSCGPLADLEPAIVHTHDAFWPAYPGDDIVAGFPYVDLTRTNVAVSVYVKGAHGLGSSIDLKGGAIRFFIGYWDGHGTEETGDDEQAFFCTNGTFSYGDNSWLQSTVVLGDDSDWMTIVKDEYTRDTSPTDLYDGPQQWGFTIYPVESGEQPTGGSLNFDRFEVVPEPGTMGLLSVGLVRLLSRRRRR
jgi:hypothetical protein